MVTTTRRGRRTAPVAVRPRQRKPPIPRLGVMPHGPGFLLLTRRGSRQLLDREARRYLGMSGEEFARRYRAGKVSDLDHAGVARVSILLPFGDS